MLYSSGSYKNPTLKAGMTVSWRQWSELLEDVQRGQKVVVRAKTRDRVGARTSSRRSTAGFPGTEPDAKGVIFTAHLFEGYVKRGANDDMSGCVVQLEILRALHDADRHAASCRGRGARSTSSGRRKSRAPTSSSSAIRASPTSSRVNINMDMVGEALRKNNGVMTMSECPDHLPCYLDGLAKSVMNYVWRTNDIVYLPDSPRGRPGGQFFPKPMVEKNGSDDAFRFFIHRRRAAATTSASTTRRSPCPGVEFFTWPDQWYHADADTPDKSDPTQMKRIAFIGAATAWAGANATDEVAAGLAAVVSEFGYARVAERDVPRALAIIEQADAAAPRGGRGASGAGRRFRRRPRDRRAAVDRRDLDRHREAAKRAVENKVQQWELYRAGLRQQMAGFARLRQAQLAPAGPPESSPPRGRGCQPLREARGGSAAAGRTRKPRPTAAPVVPVLSPAVKGLEFSLQSWPKYSAYLKEHPDALKTLGLTPQQATSILNYVNGRRSMQKIRDTVVGETGRDVTIDAVRGYLELLKTVGWVTW